MPVARALLTANAPSEHAWLTSTVSCFVEPRADARDMTTIGADLLGAIAARLPAARFDDRLLGQFRFGLDLRLADPADQDERLDAFAALDAAALSVGVDARLLPLADWIQAPARDALPTKAGGWYYATTKPDKRTAWESRYSALTALRTPLLAILLADPRRHGIGAPAELAAVHGGLAPREAWLIRKVIRDTPKTRPAAVMVRFEHAPYEGAEITAAADELVAAGWVVAIPRFNALNCVGLGRGPKAAKLTAEDLLLD